MLKDGACSRMPMLRKSVSYYMYFLPKAALWLAFKSDLVMFASAAQPLLYHLLGSAHSDSNTDINRFRTSWHCSTTPEGDTKNLVHKFSYFRLFANVGQRRGLVRLGET